MTLFGDLVRELRLAQSLGLRETASLIGISPAYLSRIERNKEPPPRPDIIKKLAFHLAADPDVLFRLSSSTDPELIAFINSYPQLLELINNIKKFNIPPNEVEKINNLVIDQK